MSFTEEEIAEFSTEAHDLFDEAERSLLALDRGESITNHYDSVFRTFHSIKGASSMMEMTALQGHMHQLENLLISQKGQSSLGKAYIELFLRGLDGAKALLAGKSIDFDYTINTTAPAEAPLINRDVEPAAPILGRVIVIDDEPDIVDLLTSMLNENGFSTLGLVGPAGIDEKLKTFKPDLVVTDIMMPGMNGLEVLSLVKKMQPDLPVMFVSGHVTKESLMQAITLGVFGVLEKPFDVKVILSTCRQAVRRHRTSMLLNQSINLIMYQFSDLSEYLKAQGKDDVRNVISKEIGTLLDQRRVLRQPL